MPTLALVKGKTSQHIESIGTQAHSTGLPHKNGQRKEVKTQFQLKEGYMFALCAFPFALPLPSQYITKPKIRGCTLNNTFK